MKPRAGFARLRSQALLGGVAFAALAASPAVAGGFINQSQSTVFNGTAYAGYAAPGSGSPSAMFLNPATMTEFFGFTTENNFSLVMPYSKITGQGGVFSPALGGFAPIFGSGSSGDIGQDALSPASYAIYPITRDLVVGLAFNAPFGFTTKPDLPWVGQRNSTTTSLKTYNATPSIAYRFNEQFSVGFGVQIQYAKARLLSSSVSPPLSGANVGFEADGWTYGITAGVTWKPLPGTQIGVGYRSQMDQDLEGDFVGFGFPAAVSSASGTLRLPDRVNLSVRQTLTPAFDVLGSVEWQNWSRIGTARISGPALANPAFPVRAIPFEYDDGWYFALGGEYRWSPDLTLRAGAAYEISPVSDRVRSTRLTDNDRFWLSGGLSYQLTERFAINASYSHVFVRDTPINIVPGNPNFNALAPFAFRGNADSHVDIVSVGLKSTWGARAEPAVMPAPVVRKY